MAPPRSPRIELLTDPDAGPHGEIRGSLPCARDEHGNALGGVRMPEVDVPVASYYPHSSLREPATATPPGGRPISLGALMGSMTPFPPDKLRKLYGTPDAYREAYAGRLEELVADHWILPGDADRMLAGAASVTFDP